MALKNSTVMPKTTALLLAGGQGERLLPLTLFRPKPAVPFGGVFRIVDFTLSNCYNSGVAQTAVLTQYRHEELESYLRKRWVGMWRDSSRELVMLPSTCGKRYRGTADAVLQNLPFLEMQQAECILIVSGDHVYDMDYAHLIRRHSDTGADLTVVAIEYPVRHAASFGVLDVDPSLRVTGFEEKPGNPHPLPYRQDVSLISMGVYVFKMPFLRDALHECCSQQFGDDFGRDVIPQLIRSAYVSAYEFCDELGRPGYWRDIGTLDSYHEASMDLLGPEPLFNAANFGVTGTTHSCAGTGLHSVISPGVQVAKSSNVESSVLMSGVRIGEGARVRRAIIEEGVHIPAGFSIGWDLESDRQQFTVSPGGVVVVSRTPAISNPYLPASGQSDLARRMARNASQAVA